MIMKKIASNVLVLCGTGILLGHRLTGYAEGMWCLPGGHTNEDEKPDQCASRELYEEAGVSGDGQKVFLTINEIDERDEFCHYFSYLKISKKSDDWFKNNEPDKFYSWSLFDYSDIPSNIIVTHKMAIDYFFSDVYMKKWRN